MRVKARAAPGVAMRPAHLLINKQETLMPIGTLTTWKADRGFGFISPDDISRGSGPVFVHLYELRRAGITKPQAGDAVAYEVGERNGKPCAIDIERLKLVEADDSVD
jgi:cold shock CspA family protein